MSNLSNEYASALFSLGEEEGISNVLHEEINTLLPLFEEHKALTQLLSSPSLTATEKTDVLQRSFSVVHPHLLHFLMLLTERGYALQIPSCLVEYLRLWRDANNVTVARVESAIALTPAEREDLINQLSTRYGKKIELLETVIPDLLGGARVWVEGELLDGSIRARLNGIKARLSHTVL